MKTFDVHSYIPVRVKVTGVEAESHEAAIAAVENDNDLQGDIAKSILRDCPDERIAAIECDEGALAVAYLVDVVGDEEYGESLSFDVDQRNGNLIQIGKEPGAGVDPNRFVSAALANHSSNEALTHLNNAHDGRHLIKLLDKDETLAPFKLASLLIDLDSSSRLAALARLDEVIAEATAARAKIVDMNPAAIRHLDYDQLEVPVCVNGPSNVIGIIKREPDGLWRNATYEATRSSERIVGLRNIMRHLDAVLGHDTVLTLHPGYHAVYRGDSGVPFARVMRLRSGKYGLRVFEPHYSATFASVEAAVAGIPE